jgi:hypothetical protein
MMPMSVSMAIKDIRSVFVSAGRWKNKNMVIVSLYGGKLLDIY